MPRGKLRTRLTRAVQIGCAGVLLAFYWGLIRLSPRSVVRHAVAASRPDHGGSLSGLNTGRLREITSVVDRAADLHLLRLGCLERALCTRSMLTMCGETATVVIGIRKDSSVFAAHAWVQVKQRAVDAERRHFADFIQLR